PRPSDAVKLAHLADLHLGFRQYERQTPRGGNQREADVADAFRRAVDDLLVQRPDLIVLAGDIFHSVRPTNPAILYLFQQLHRLRAGRPDAPIVMIAGEHDTPRSAETGTILRLYEALGVDVVVDQARHLTFSKLDCAVLAAPHQAVIQPERPALRPQRGSTINILLLHGQLAGLGDKRGTAEYGGALVDQHDLAPAQWDYVALGHYHVAQQVAANAWYPGSIEYVTPNPWGQLQDEEEQGRRGKGYLLVDLPGSRVTRAGGPDAAAAAPPRELPPARRYRPRVRSRDHGDHRAERLRQDVYPRGDRLGAVRRAGGARGQGLDPPARREGSGGRRGGPRVPPRRPRVPREARALHRGAPPGRPGDREFAQGGHRQAGAHVGNDPRRVLQHLLHGPKGVGRDGGARQDGAGGVPVARARVRAPAR